METFTIVFRATGLDLKLIRNMFPQHEVEVWGEKATIGGLQIHQAVEVNIALSNLGCVGKIYNNA